MLFRRVVLDAIAEGRVTLAFRRWDRHVARAGARHRTPRRRATAPGPRSCCGWLRRAPAMRAAELGIATDGLKRNVRQMGEPGLTEGLGTGYRLSPRGRAYPRKRDNQET